MQLCRNPRQRRYTPRPRRSLARLWRSFLTGLVAIIPLGVPAYVVYWLFAVGADNPGRIPGG